MTFIIGRGFAELQILKNEIQMLKRNETDPIPWTFWYILIKFCIAITIDII